MLLDVTFTPRELARLDRRSHAVAIIDVVRASTTMVQGLASGCPAFIPVPSVASARRTARALGSPDVLVGGERRGVAVRGFDLGNSPLEYTPERVKGKTVVFTTTNGTAAIAAATDARRVVIAAFVNLEAVIRHLVADGGDVTVAAAGRLGRPALDDTVCAGLIVERVRQESEGGYTLTDGAYLALEASKEQRPRLREMLAQAASGRALKALGAEDDLDFCARLDVFDLVPSVEDGRVIL